MNLLNRKVTLLYLPLVLLTILLINGCSTAKYQANYIKDNKRNTWNQHNRRISKHYRKYSINQHVLYSLKRGQKYMLVIHQIFRQYNLPPELAYLPILESSFDTKATSRTGAKGLWQFKAATARECGLSVGWIKDERLDWQKATVAAAKYLEKLGKRFNYNWELALAAYNGGPSYISKQMKLQHSWDFWDLQIKKEPSQYVPKFLAILRVAKEKYPRLYYKNNPRNLVASR
jgi:membrane-bound lytic murein transglycosylase D